MKNHSNYTEVLNKTSFDHSGMSFDELISKGNHSLINTVIYKAIDSIQGVNIQKPQIAKKVDNKKTKTATAKPIEVKVDKSKSTTKKKK